MNREKVCLILLVLLFNLIVSAQENEFQSSVNTHLKPWTGRSFENDADNFQFAVVSDRTGGHRPGVFGRAVNRLNLLMPEFVMSVGDLIEGYTEEKEEIDRQWAEFDSLLDPLGMRFFYVPGNHDISNDVMRQEWLNRYGRSYYHFTYKNVLFLAFDSNDGDGVMFSEDQLQYFEKALQENEEVRWTFLFMHHPIWQYREFNGFDRIEQLLKDRPYTVFAGHYHRYMQALRRDRNYYVLATTGGGSRLLGPRFGQFDHVTWITMTDNGPKVINLKLDGLVDHDIVTENSAAKAGALIEALNFNSLTTFNSDQTAGKMFLNIRNDGPDTIYFTGRIYHNHHLNFDRSAMDLRIAPESIEQVILNWESTGDIPWERIDPVEMDYTIGYKVEPLTPPFSLEGVYLFPKVLQKEKITFTARDVFTDQHEVSVEHDFQNMTLRYTLHGKEPNKNSPEYSGPISLSQSATLKVSLFDEAENATASLEKTYKKVVPLEPVRVKKAKKGLKYAYYEGEYKILPDFSTLKPKKEGISLNFDVEGLSEREDHYAFEFEGFIEVPEDGIYTFYIRSDDGSQVYLHDELVVDNDGSHSARQRSGYVALKKGMHPIRIAYFEDYLGEALQLFIQAPSEENQKEVPFDQLFHE